MSSLPLPKVTEISFDDLAVLLPADCKIRLTPCPEPRPELANNDNCHDSADQTSNLYILIA